jgi:putative ABC transport system permease protein
MISARWFRRLSISIRSLVQRDRYERELDEELQFHLDKQFEQYNAKGYSSEEARYLAIRSLAGIEQRKEECRDVRRVSFFGHAMQDLRYGVRVLRKNPGFALAVVATLALGIGATTAVFSVVYGVVLQPLPYREPKQLVGAWTIANSIRFPAASVANYLDWRAENTVFEDIGIIKLVSNFNITGDGEPERVLGGRSTPSIFRVLAVQPMLGRVFTDTDGQAEDKVVLSHALWKRRYGSDRQILGKKILLNGAPYTVLGVMPSEFQYPNREFALWTPLVLNPEEARVTFDYACIARLKRGVTRGQAQTQMAEIQSRIGRDYPQFQGMQVEITSMLDDLVNPVRRPLYLLLAAVLCLLLIGCVNLANMLVARSMTRSHELVVRATLGANKRRLVLQSIMEVLPLTVLGGVCGLLLTKWMLSLLVPWLPPTLPRLEAIRIDWEVLAFAIVALFATSIVTGIWPALQVMRWNMNGALRESGRTTTFGRGTSRIRNGLIISQIAAVVILMVVSALLIRSFVALQNVDPGFHSDNVLTVHLAVSRSKYRSDVDVTRLIQRVLERVSALPGVISAGMVNRLPLAGGNQTGALDFEGTALPRTSEGTLQIANFDWRTATPDYFRTLEIPLIQGRVFQQSDTIDRPLVGLIDDRVSRLVWPQQNPVGKRFRIGLPNAPWVEIIGVVGHVRHAGLDVDPRPQVYWPYSQRAQDRMALAVRGNQDPKQFAAAVISAIHEVDPEQPVYDVRSMDEVVERSLAPQWLTATLVSLFAALALVLATVGVYGVLSYSVGLRRREIGIRIALGSSRHEVIWIVLRQGVALAGLGIIIGIGGALLLSRTLTTLLYGITTSDALSFISASLVLLLVALAASYIPARRASCVDPVSVLRTD